MGLPGRTRSREEKLSKTALPQRSGALLRTEAHRPQLLTKAVSSAWVWLPSGCTPQDAESRSYIRFQAAPSRWSAHNLHVTWHTTSNSAKAELTVSDWKHVKWRMYCPDNTKTGNEICQVWCVGVLINQTSQKNVTSETGLTAKSPISKLPCENHKPDLLASLPAAVLT